MTNQLSAAQTFSLLPRSLLALRVSKIPDEGKTKHIKGLWTVKVEPQQEIREELYYAFFYEPRSWVQMLTAVGVVAGILTVVLFPLWPPIMRLGVWYLSMGCLGLVGLFILMSIFRLILFVITMFVASPGLWLYPNLFEDVGFFDSFRPVWAWHKVCELSIVCFCADILTPRFRSRSRRERRLPSRLPQALRKLSSPHRRRRPHSPQHPAPRPTPAIPWSPASQLLKKPTSKLSKNDTIRGARISFISFPVFMV